MNLANYSLKSLLRCTSLTNLKFSHQNYIIPLICRLQNKEKFENRCFLCTSNKLLAGHSKWQNIKHIKAANDLKKNALTSKYAFLIRRACKEGTCDPVSNPGLAKIIAEAKSRQVPGSTIENAIKNAQKSKDGGKPAILTYSSGDLVIIVDVHTDNINRTRQQIKQIIKKIGFQDAQRDVAEASFEEKGVIITRGDLEKAIDDAILAGAEDVNGDDENLTFICDRNDFYSVKKEIENMNYEIDYADVDRIPYMEQTLEEAALVKLRETIEKIEDNEDVIKVSINANV